MSCAGSMRSAETAIPLKKGMESVAVAAAFFCACNGSAAHRLRLMAMIFKINEESARCNIIGYVRVINDNRIDSMLRMAHMSDVVKNHRVAIYRFKVWNIRFPDFHCVTIAV